MANIVHSVKRCIMELYKEMEKAFSLMEKAFSQEALLHFKNTPAGDLYRYHYGLGIWIRNHFLFPREKPLYQLFWENGITHQDEMSYLMIRLFHYYISKRI